MALTLWSLTIFIWVVVSILCATAAIFAFMQPFWVVNHESRKSFGLYGFCIYEAPKQIDPSPWLDPLTGTIVDVIIVDGGGFQVVGNDSQSTINASSVLNQTMNNDGHFQTVATSCGEVFGNYYHFAELFTVEGAWKASGVFYGTATILLCFSAILSVVVVFLNEFDVNVRRLCRMAGLIQLGSCKFSVYIIGTAGNSQKEGGQFSITLIAINRLSVYVYKNGYTIAWVLDVAGKGNWRLKATPLSDRLRKHGFHKAAFINKQSNRAL